MESRDIVGEGGIEGLAVVEREDSGPSVSSECELGTCVRLSDRDGRIQRDHAVGLEEAHRVDERERCARVNESFIGESGHGRRGTLLGTCKRASKGGGDNQRGGELARRNQRGQQGITVLRRLGCRRNRERGERGLGNGSSCWLSRDWLSSGRLSRGRLSSGRLSRGC